MTIGQALKEAQRALGITEQEMSGDIISKSAYSRVVNGKRNIGSDLLVKLLLKNGIDINNFFSKIEDTYSPESVKLEKSLSYKMAQAVNNHKKEQVKKYYIEISKARVSDYLKKRAKIAYYIFNNKVDALDNNFKRSVLEDLNKNENWILNSKALRLFSSAISVIPAKYVELEISFFFRKIKRLSVISESMKERYASILENYLHWKYNYEVENGKIEIDENVRNAISYLEQLDSSPSTLIYIISARYYASLFEKNIEKAKKIKHGLIEMGCTLVVNNWPV